MINTAELHIRIVARAEEFVYELFGDAAKLVGIQSWRVGQHGSLAISIKNDVLVFHSHEEGLGGDAVILWQRERGGTVGEALRSIAAWSGVGQGDIKLAPVVRRQNKRVPVGPTLPPDATVGTQADWRELAALRRVSADSVCAATHLGTLVFGTVCGCRCWILTDARGLIAEARRLDGMAFPPNGSLGKRKAHTLKGSVKSWPVGLLLKAFQPEADAPFLVAEGGPDYLAALDFAMREKPDCLRWHPIAFLGAGSASEIHPEALKLLRGRRARFYPHCEPSGAGVNAVARWAAQFAANGAITDAFSFAALRKVDGTAVKDLNDCTQLHPNCLGELEGLLP